MNSIDRLVAAKIGCCILSTFAFVVTAVSCRADNIQDIKDFLASRNEIATPIHYEISHSESYPKFFFGPGSVDENGTAIPIVGEGTDHIWFNRKNSAFRRISIGDVLLSESNQKYCKFIQCLHDYSFDGDSPWGVCRMKCSESFRKADYDVDILANILQQAKDLRIEVLDQEVQEASLNDINLFPLFFLQGLLPLAPSLKGNLMGNNEIDAQSVEGKEGPVVCGFEIKGITAFRDALKKESGECSLVVSNPPWVDAKFEIVTSSGGITEWRVIRKMKDEDYLAHFKIRETRKPLDEELKWAISDMVYEGAEISSLNGPAIFRDGKVISSVTENVESSAAPSRYVIIIPVALAFGVLSLVFLLGSKRKKM